MGKLFILGASVTGAMLLFSCSKELDRQPAPAQQAQSSPDQVLNVTLNANEIYTLVSEKASELNIHKQAAHFKESSTSVNNETGQIVYKYTPSDGFTGLDEVTLSSIKKAASYSTGCFHGNYGDQPDQTLMKIYTTIKIKVNK